MITHVFKGYYKITYKHGSPVTTSPFRDIFFFFTVVPTPCPVNHLCIVQSLYHVSATFSTPTFLIIGISTVSLCFYFLFRLTLRLPPCLYTQHLSIEPLLRCLKYFFFLFGSRLSNIPCHIGELIVKNDPGYSNPGTTSSY